MRPHVPGARTLVDVVIAIVAGLPPSACMLVLGGDYVGPNAAAGDVEVDVARETGVTPKLGTLRDTFDSIDPSKWIQTVGAGYTLGISNGQLEIDDTTERSDWARLDSAVPYDATNSELSVNLVNAGNAASAAPYVWFKVAPDQRNGVEIGVNNAQLYAKVWVDGTASTVAAVSYAPASMQWLRLRESLGVTYWEYAQAKGSPWVQLYSENDPVLLSRAWVELGAGAWPGIVGTVLIDDLNE